MTHRQAFIISTTLIVACAMGLMLIAISAAMNAVWSAALFIGLMSLALLATVIHVLRGHWKARQSAQA